MTIGFISFEYPPDTAVGGISTYVYQASRMMLLRGHTVEVFSASYTRTGSDIFEGILVHRVKCAENERFEFSRRILPVFLERNRIMGFEVIESPEYSADGLLIKEECPDVSLIVKLHTPHFLIRELTTHYDSLFKRSYYMVANWMHGQFIRPYWRYLKKEEDPDYKIVSAADQIHTPSVSLGQIVQKKWGISPERIYHVPYPYIPKRELLGIDLTPAARAEITVTFVGRLEVRKGLVELCKAIPLVLKKNPAVKFRFSGASENSPVPELDMKSYIFRELKSYEHQLTFLHVPVDRVHEIYASTDICVFPSIWENFPNVCLEAMSAGRAIVASREGGMKDMLEDPACGMLVDPLDPNEIAEAILYLISHPDVRKELGTKARSKVLDSYNANRIGELMEKMYQQAISAKEAFS